MWRAQLLSTLVRQLNGEARQEVQSQALKAALAIRDEVAKARALAALAPQLAQEVAEQVLSQALEEVENIEDKRSWPDFLLLAGIGPEAERAEVLAELAHQLTGEVRKQTLRRGLEAAQAIANEGRRAHVLTELVPQLSEDLLLQGLMVAQTIGSERSRAEVLVALAPQISEEWLAQMLQAVHTIADQDSRAEVLAALAPQLTEELLIQVLEIAYRLTDKGKQAKILADLAPRVKAETRHQVLAQGLRAALTIESSDSRAQVVTVLKPQIAGQANLRPFRCIVIQGLQERYFHTKRAGLLNFLATPNLLAPPLFTQPVLEAIAGHVVEVCTEWEWL